MKIEIISNINMDSLKFYMKDYSFISECAFGNYMLDLLDKNSTLYKSESEFIILFIDINELKEDINELLHAVAFFINNSSKPIILNTVCYLPFYLDTFLHYTLENELMINQKKTLLTIWSQSSPLHKKENPFYAPPLALLELKCPQ